MESKNLQKAYAIYRLMHSGGDRQPSTNDKLFMQRYIKMHSKKFKEYVKLLEENQKAREKVANSSQVSGTEQSAGRTKAEQKTREIASYGKDYNQNSGEITEPIASKMQKNAKSRRTNAAVWNGIDAAIKDGAIDGTQVKALEAKGDTKLAYELGRKLVREFLIDANKVLDDNEQLLVDGIYGKKSKDAFVKYKAVQQALSSDDQSTNQLLKEGSTGNRFQMRRAFHFGKNANDSTLTDSVGSLTYLRGLPIDSTARFNLDNAYIIPDISDSAVYTPRGRYINYSAGITQMPGDTIYSRHPIVIGEESYEPYLNEPYVGRRGNLLYTPVYNNDRVRNDTVEIIDADQRGLIYPVDSIPGLYTDDLRTNLNAWGFYQSVPIRNAADSTRVLTDSIIAHPELLNRARALVENRGVLDTIQPVYINTQRKGGLLKKRCKK